MSTIADVAALARVGVGTVSRVLNGNAQVSPETRQRVQAAMEQLGYRPSRARSGNKRSHGLIGVIIPFFDQPSSYQRLRGVVQALQPHDLEMVLYNVDAPDRARARLADLPNDQLDGLIVISLPIGPEEGHRLSQARCPVVLVDTAHAALPSIVIDDRAGGRMATEHLLSLGHTRIAFIGQPARNPFGFVSSPLREEGYVAALADAGLPAPTEYRRHGPHLRSVARQFTAELLALANPPTAIVVASDLQALGVLEAARHAKRDVPNDLSITGYDDIEFAIYSGLTTVRQPLERSGERGTEVLTTALSSGSRPTAFLEELPLELAVRTTTASPPGATSAPSRPRPNRQSNGV
jgi:LacI family transcriptional regulator